MGAKKEAHKEREGGKEVMAGGNGHAGFGMPYFTVLATYFSYALLLVLGRLRDAVSGHGRRAKEDPPPVCRGDEDFYTRRMYHRIHDCWNRPIRGAPGGWVEVLMRRFTGRGHELECTGESKECINLGSYNYLGFASPDSECTPHVVEALERYGTSPCGSEAAGCATKPQRELEREVASFVGKEDALVIANGYGTNSCALPALLGAQSGSLVVSDANNHASIVQGCRLSGARVKVFRHNDPEHLEMVLRQSIAEGRPRTRRPWRRIMVAVEGLYSMEGEVCRLRELVTVAKRYKAYVYLDEAHSIGALGQTGRGACEYCKVDPAKVDVLMGTFTKSFGSCGGYIAASKETVAHIRRHSPAPLYACTMPAPAAQQALSALRTLRGESSWEGLRRLERLKGNANYLRRELRDLGLEVLGSEESPILPVMLYNPAKIAAFSRECLKRGLAVVVVGFPATPLLLSRSRICVSASHSREDLARAAEHMREVANHLGLRYNSQPSPSGLEQQAKEPRSRPLAKLLARRRGKPYHVRLRRHLMLREGADPS